MLRDIKKKSTSLGSMIIMGLLIIAFAFWGVSGSLMSSNSDAVATVNGEKITLNDFNKANQAARNRMTTQFGDAIGPEFFETESFKRGVISQLVDAELMRQQASKYEYDVSPLKIKQTIETAPSLQIDGKFSKEAYANYLMSIGKSAEILQRELKDDLTGSAIPQLIAQTAFSLDSEVSSQYRNTNQKRSFTHFEISADDFKDGIEVTEEEINQHYIENSQNYMTEDMVSVKYIELNSTDLPIEIEVTEEQILTEYESKKQNSLTPERRKASHILLSIDGNDDEVKNKIEAIAKRINDGENFADVAKEVSEDSGSAQNGGDLGWVETGVMVKEFEDALFAMEAGTVSDPVKSQYGYHIIQLNEIIEPEIQPLEELRESIIADIKQIGSEEAFLEQANQLEESIVDADNVLEVVADTTGLQIKTTELFSRNGGTDITANQKFKEAAYSDLILNENQVSEMIDLGQNHIAYIQLNEFQPAAVKPLDEVKESIVTTLTNEKAKDLAKNKASELLAKINSNELTIQTAASSVDKTLVESVDIPRSGSELPFTLVSNVFKMAFDAEKQNVETVDSSNNAFSLVKLSSISNPEDAEITEEDKLTLATQLERSLINNELTNLTNDLKAEASITITETVFEDNTGL